MDMSRVTPEDPRSRGAQPTSGLEGVNLQGRPELTEEEVDNQAKSEALDYLRNLGIDIPNSDVSMNMFEDDDPVLNAFRDRIRQRSRVSSILNEQRAINQERNQGLADDFDNKFSGSLQEALSGYGDTHQRVRLINLEGLCTKTTGQTT